MDIDQELLHQFSCLGTTDKDELIKQLQVLVGSNVTYATAHFFLDMNNWNLQAAIGSYFDFGTSTKLPSMALIRSECASSLDDILTVPPCTCVTKKLILWNNGDDPWPEECVLKFAGGESMGNQKIIKVPALAPKNFAEVEVPLESPNTPGMYESQWRTCTPSGSYFGDTIWVLMAVTAAGSEDSELAVQLSHLNTCGENPPNHRPADSNCLLNPFGSQPSGGFME